MPTTATDAELYRWAALYREALEAGSLNASTDVTRAWLQVQQRVELEVQQLLKKMEAARLAGVKISPAWLYQERRLANLTDLIQAEAARWAPTAERRTAQLLQEAMDLAQESAQRLAREAAAASLPGIEATFDAINPENLASLVGNLSGGPIQQLLLSYGAEAAQGASQALIQGVILGKGSDWIARQLRTAMDIPRWKADTLARTEALRVYRETSRATYQASNVVGTWVWDATLDRRTCPACMVMHGTEHPLDEPLDGHPRCRCAMIPRTKPWSEVDPSLADLPDTRPPIQTGEEWFSRQSPLTQRAMLGPGKYDAWSQGQISLQDMVARTHSPVWGTMRRERSMLEIQQGRNANWFNQTVPANRFQGMSDEDLKALVNTGDREARKELAARLKARTEAPDVGPVTTAVRPGWAELGDTRPPSKKWTTAQLDDAAAQIRTLSDKGLLNFFHTRHAQDPALRWEGLKEGYRRNLWQRAPEPDESWTSELPTMRVPDPDAYATEARLVNPRYAESIDYQVNCTRCTTTYELRRRGFDVEAVAYGKQDPLRLRQSEWGWWEDGMVWGADPAASIGQSHTWLQAVSAIKKMPDGARGSISVKWKSGGAHIFNWEYRGGHIRWIDGQTGQTSVDDYWNRGSVDGRVQIMRLDNLPLTELLKDYVKPRTP